MHTTTVPSFSFRQEVIDDLVISASSFLGPLWGDFQGGWYAVAAGAAIIIGVPSFDIVGLWSVQSK